METRRARHHRTSSDSGDDFASDTEALLSGSRKSDVGSRRRERILRVGLGAWAILSTLAAALLAYKLLIASSISTDHSVSGKRNVVFMVSDGMGPSSLSLTRAFMQHARGLPWDKTLTLDKHLIGTSRTRSTSSLVTDSAAGATAFSCGLKSYNGAISVLPDGSPCGTVLEAAKLAGYMTGLVVTTRITDATPACFSAHVNLRSEEDRIAEQQIGNGPLGRVVDLMLGGGQCHFLSNASKGSCRQDGRDLVDEARKKFGFTYIDSREQFNRLAKEQDTKLPILGLFAPTDIPYDLDRDENIYPGLDEMTATALRILENATKHSRKGFFLMVEGSRIDHAGHGNDPAAQAHEVLAYDRAFSRALDWVKKHRAVLVSTSDHETGGLAVARQLHDSYPEYLWHPQVLGNVSHSGEHLGALYKGFAGTPEEEDLFVRDTILRRGLGIHDASNGEILGLKKAKGFADYYLADMVSRRAQIGWSTHGHSGVDVNIYGSAGTDQLRGNHENTDIGEFLASYMGLDLSSVTKRLKHTNNPTHDSDKPSWMGKPLEELQGEQHLKFDAHHIDAYHGDFKRCRH